MSDLASIAAATAAGYTRIQVDRGTLTGPGQDDVRYETVLEKYVVGGTHQTGFLIRAYGESNTSADDADTQALDALNNQRLHRYSADANVSDDTEGTILVRDGS